MNMLKRLWKEEEGQGITEYGLILGLVVMMGVAIFLAFQPQLQQIFTDIGTKLAGIVS